MLIGIAGRIGHGKDVIASYLAREHGFVIVRFSDALKAEVRERLPRTLTVFWRQAYHSDPTPSDLDRLVWELKPEGVRELLQEYGTEVRRADDPSHWVVRWKRRVRALTSVNIVTPDVRFPDEAEAIRQHGSLWRVVRPRPDLEGSYHVSEHALDAWSRWDAILVNDTTTDALEHHVERLVGLMEEANDVADP